MRIIIISLIAIFACLPSRSETPPFRLQITQFPKQMLMGTQTHITGEIANISGKPIKVGAGPRGFKWRIVAKRADGKEVKNCPPSDDPLIVGYGDPSLLSADWRQEFGLDFWCTREPGTWTIYAEVSSAGPYVNHKNEAVAAESVWNGKVQGEAVTVEVIEPVGVDQQAYEEFYLHATCKPLRDCEEQLIKKYPTSTYAGYALSGLRPVVGQDLSQEIGFDTLTNGQYFKTIPKCGDPYDPNRPLRDTQAEASKRMKLLTDFLAAHPDFPDAHKLTAMRYQRVELALVLGRYLDADEDLAWMAKNADEEILRTLATNTRTRLRARGLVTAK